MISLFYAGVGAGLGFGGIFLLWSAWKRRGATKLAWIGWLLIVSALFVWAVAGGHDRGVALGAIVISLQALAFIGFGMLSDGRSKTKPVKQVTQQITEKTAWTVYLSRIATTCLVLPIAGGISFLTALGLHELLGMVKVEAANAFAISVYMFPVIWASLSVFLLISQRIVFKTVLLFAMIVLSALVLVLGN